MVQSLWGRWACLAPQSHALWFFAIVTIALGTVTGVGKGRHSKWSAERKQRRAESVLLDATTPLHHKFDNMDASLRAEVRAALEVRNNWDLALL